MIRCMIKINCNVGEIKDKYGTNNLTKVDRQRKTVQNNKELSFKKNETM